MTDDDIDEALKENWIEVLHPYNDELLSQQLDKFAKSFELKQNIAHTLRYRGKLRFDMGRYEQSVVDFTKLLEFETNDAFALRCRGETYYIMRKYDESLADFNKLLEVNANDTWDQKPMEKLLEGEYMMVSFVFIYDTS